MKTYPICHVAIALTLTACLCSCKDEAAQSRITDLEIQMTAYREANLKLVEWLKERDSDLEAQMATHREANLKFAEWLDEREKRTSDQISALFKHIFLDEKYAVIDPSGQGFSTLESNNGTFVVACKGAEAYLDGQKLILHIGNPYNMTYSGFDLKAEYGSRPEPYPSEPTPEEISEWQSKNDEWQKTLKQKSLSFTTELPPGSWTKVEMILTPAKPEEVAYIRISMITNQVSLRRAAD